MNALHIQKMGAGGCVYLWENRECLDIPYCRLRRYYFEYFKYVNKKKQQQQQQQQSKGNGSICLPHF